ncbi:MAG TPA: EAL domain-containing protein, partial [Micromonosporaceae bacterium]|nr:EAL domain-containing protein [Micromonosporaceae bacterium]
WPLALVFVGLFVVANLTALRFEFRRQATSVSLVELPLLLALFYLSPLLVVTSRVTAAFLVNSRKRLAPVKLWFNVACAAANAAVSSLIVHSPVVWNSDAVTSDGWLQVESPATWLVLFVAVIVGTFVTLAAVVGVITLVQGRPSPGDLLRTTVQGTLVAAANITLGLVVLLTLQQTLWALLLLSVLLAFFVVTWRSFAISGQQHNTLSELYKLTEGIRDTRHGPTLFDALLHRARRLLGAEYATLWLPAQGRHPEVLLAARVDNEGLLDNPPTPDSLRRRALESGRIVAVSVKLGDDELRAELRQHGVKDAIVVPLRSGSAVIGTLEVSGRLADLAHFGQDDVRLLEAVAAHVAVAVENSRLVDRLRFDAYHDALTGLPNRRRIIQALEESVKVRAPGEVVAVLLFDIDGMRDVNESLGHAAGDKLMAEVSRRLRSLAPPAALVGRVGSDEFVLTLRADSADRAVALAEDLRAKLADPMVLGSLTLDIDTAVGVVVHPDHGTEPAVLLQRADLAAQAAGLLPSGVQMFNPSLESRSVRRLGLANDLRRAIENDELEIYFQPKVALRDRRLVGVECLARWEHPTHGSVAPEDFVAVAEHTGLLSRLTDVVLAEGLRRCRQWADAGRPLNVAVNLSSRTLLDPEFPARVERMLAEHGVEPGHLTFEITEAGVVNDSDRPMPILNRLRDMGVRLSVDDFGTGYSSLSYLRRLPVHEVKIDQEFVQGMATDPGDLAIVRAVVDLSRHFGLSVVAEGVESELTLDLLEEIGCDVGQGFLFSRPLPYERLEAWFGAQTEAEPTPLGEVRRLRAVP